MENFLLLEFALALYEISRSTLENISFQDARKFPKFSEDILVSFENMFLCYQLDLMKYAMRCKCIVQSYVLKNILKHTL